MLEVVFYVPALHAPPTVLPASNITTRSSGCTSRYVRAAWMPYRPAPITSTSLCTVLLPFAILVARNFHGLAGEVNKD